MCIKDSDFEKMLRDFVKQSKIQGETQYSGDYKTGNKASNKLFKIWRKLKANSECLERFIDNLINHEEPNVRIWVCSIALDTQYRTDKAETVLKEITNIPNIGILGHNAEMTIKVWKEQGFLLK